jgi:hypothetical protein
VRPVSLKVSTSDFAFAAGHRLNAINLLTGRPHLAHAARGSSIPKLTALPLHCEAGRIADLDPDRTGTGSIGAADSLGNDAFCAKGAHRASSSSNNDAAKAGRRVVQGRMQDQVGARCGGDLVRPAERCCQQASRVALTKLCPGNDSTCDHLLHAPLRADQCRLAFRRRHRKPQSSPQLPCIKARIGMAAPPQ